MLNNLQNQKPNDFKIGWTPSSEKMMIISSAGESRYGILVRNIFSGHHIALLCGSDKKLAKAIAADIDYMINNSKISTHGVIRKFNNILRSCKD